jgi:hypothetical protein
MEHIQALLYEECRMKFPFDLNDTWCHVCDEGTIPPDIPTISLLLTGLHEEACEEYVYMKIAVSV